MTPGPDSDRVLLAHMRDCIVRIVRIEHDDIGIDLAAVWLVFEEGLPPLAEALGRMVARMGNQP